MIMATPSRLLDVRVLSPERLPTSSSIGFETCFSRSSGEAPGYGTCTKRTGKVTSGNISTGMRFNEKLPKINIKRTIQEIKIGLLIDKPGKFIIYYSSIVIKRRP
ncbi:hypothetical protein D3C87_1602350 [compost metagenome]